jgi:hypothetical protein
LKSQLPYKNEYFFAGSFHEFMLDKIKKAGLKLNMPSGKEYFEELDKISSSCPIKFPIEVADSDVFWEKKVPLKTLEALEKEPVEYDSVFVDEAQDLLLVEYFVILEKILKGGLNKGKWCLFSDPQQDIIKKGNLTPYKEAILILGKPRDSFTRSQPPLTINCRNSVNIGNAISMLKLGEQKYLDKNSDGPFVQFRTWSTIDEQKEILERSLDNLLHQQKVKSGEITILSAFDPHECLDWYEASVLSKLNK